MWFKLAKPNKTNLQYLSFLVWEQCSSFQRVSPGAELSTFQGCCSEPSPEGRCWSEGGWRSPRRHPGGSSGIPPWQVAQGFELFEAVTWYLARTIREPVLPTFWTIFLLFFSLKLWQKNVTWQKSQISWFVEKCRQKVEKKTISVGFIFRHRHNTFFR